MLSSEEKRDILICAVVVVCMPVLLFAAIAFLFFAVNFIVGLKFK